MAAQVRGPIVVLTGAGISAEFGLPTFRGAGGLWEGHRAEEVATPGAFARDPGLVQRFYNARRAKLRDPAIMPNAAHLALAELERRWPGEFLLVTQNVDDLHDRAGSRRLIHLHGELRRALCLACAESSAWDGDLGAEARCPNCDAAGRLRPDIVWFGELPYRMDEVYAALGRCDDLRRDRHLGAGLSRRRVRGGRRRGGCPAHDRAQPRPVRDQPGISRAAARAGF